MNMIQCSQVANGSLELVSVNFHFCGQTTLKMKTIGISYFTFWIGASMAPKTVLGVRVG